MHLHNLCCFSFHGKLRPTETSCSTGRHRHVCVMRLVKKRLLAIGRMQPESASQSMEQHLHFGVQKMAALQLQTQMEADQRRRI